MEGLVDPGSPRRGSLSSLQRQSSGSSHNFRLASPGSNSSKTSSSNNNESNHIENLSRELDKFVRNFIIKTVQVVVQSRIVSAEIPSLKNNKPVRTECKPNGNDWFSINISDIAEISDKTKAIIDSDCFTVKSSWRICCEISIKTSDGHKVVLEHWIISNKAKQQPTSTVTTQQQQASPKSVHSNPRLSPVQLTSSNNGNINSASAINTTPPSNRLRTATFSNTMRTRLNSIDDCPGDGDNNLVNKLSVDTATTTTTNNNNYNNDKNNDIKSSTSCYSLSNSPANRYGNQTITTSPSINSLNNNHTMDQSFNSTSNNSQASKQGSSASSSIYTIYNKMSLLLKTLMTTTHIVPAYRLASNRSTSQADSYVICYRLYTCSPANQSTRVSLQSTQRGSIEDIYYNLNSESPSKRSTSSSNVSYGSLNIRDFVELDELEHFSPITKLGSIKTEINELDVSVCYRTDVANSSQLLRSPRLRDMYNKIKDEDCIIAAKQLLAGNDQHSLYQRCHEYDFVDNPDNDKHQDPLSFIDKPLRPAFATPTNPNEINKLQDPNLELVETAFEGLLKINHPEDDHSVKKNCRSSNAQSDPIQVPNMVTISNKKRELYPNLSCNSTPKSTDSFVFVDINPPFASEEQNGINSFFNGPSPTFSQGLDSLKDVDELTSQFADIEANASQLDEFVDNICISEDEEDEEGRNN